ncbi:hypothetical protein FB451DRAFT_1388205 [Mycena latifolia]|nr:hypothetical protein FB451DRAFT_1388205 [Mycena latifolia]
MRASPPRPSLPLIYVSWGYDLVHLPSYSNPALLASGHELSMLSAQTLRSAGADACPLMCGTPSSALRRIVREVLILPFSLPSRVGHHLICGTSPLPLTPARPTPRTSPGRSRTPLPFSSDCSQGAARTSAAVRNVIR